MPFPHTSSGSSSRARKAKEKDKDVRQPSGTARRLREPSRATNSRMLPPQAQLSLYDQQNITLERLPALPSSGATSPILAPSPVLHATQISSKYTDISQFPHHFYTPKALQPYLEDDNDLGTGEAIELSLDEGGKKLPISKQKEHWHPNEAESTERKPPPVLGREEVPPSASSRITSPLLAYQDPLVSRQKVSPRISPSGQDGMVESNNSTSHELFSSFPPSTSYVGTQLLAPRYAIPYHFPMAQSGNRFGELNTMHMQPGSYFPSYGYHNSISGQTNEFASQGQRHVVFESDLTASQGLNAEMSAGSSYRNPYPPTEDDASDLIHRIQSTIPDLHLLVNRYREVCSQLQLQEIDIRQMEAQAVETLKQKEIHIDRLTKDLETASKRHCTETSKLRFEIGNLEESHKELQDSCVVGQSTRAQLEAELDAWKVKAEKNYELKKQSLEQDLRSRIDDEPGVQSKVSDMSSDYFREVNGLKSKWRQERQEQEANQAKTMASLEAAFKACQADLEDTLRREQEGHESWKKEREALQKSWNQQREILMNEWKEERQSLLALHEQKTKELPRDRLLLQQQGYDRIEVESENLHQQIDQLKADWGADKIKYTNEINGLKASLANLDSENGRLQKMIEAFGEATDLRSRGDMYFTDAFARLRKEITELATEHCRGPLTKDLPSYVTSNIPAKLPDFSSDSSSSVGLRSLYVQHAITRTLTLRIFQPFLFTLSHRHAQANRLFEDMSRQLRQKSTRRESSWRQHTLHAAYTAPSAKQAVNKVAGDIVNDICSEIKYLIYPGGQEHIQAAVRRIVKIAAETWRYARLEKEVVTVSLSPEHYPKMFDAIEAELDEERPEHGFVEHILPVHPCVQRESRQTEIYLEGDSKGAQCVYSRGAALYSDSHIVQARRAELEHQEKQLESHSSSTYRDTVEGQPQLARFTEDSLNKTTSNAQLPPSAYSEPLERPKARANSVPFRQLPNNEHQLDRFGRMTERQLPNTVDAHSRTTVSWSSESSLNNGRTTSTATSPAEIDDERRSSGAAPPIPDAW